MTIRRPRSILALLGIAGGTAISIPLIALAGPGTAQAPDLRADPVQDIEGPGVYSGTEGGLGDNALLIRFDGFVTNVGRGPLEIAGNPQIPGSVVQLARTAPGQPPTVPKATPEVVFEGTDSHDHWHLKRAMRYSLWNLEKTAQVAPGQKVGFCLYDIQDGADVPGAPVRDRAAYGEQVTLFCQSERAGGDGAAATSLRMGTSAGWRDVYDKGLAYQWVDVSSTTPGTYLIGSEADPDNVLWEGAGAGEVNPPAFSSQQVTVPGWVAQAVALTQTGASQAVPLASAKFGTQTDANLLYRVVSGPTNGTLNAPVGAAFAGTQPQPLVYTPSPGYTGADSFTYAASSASSSFPMSPPVATVTIAGRAPSIAISGAPAGLVAGTSAQLTASLANIAGGVAWSATAGTISSAGLYTAPTAPPAGNVVTIHATSTANPGLIAQVAITIAPAPRTTARPDVGGPLSAGNSLMSPVRVTNLGQRIIVGRVAIGARAGRVVFSATIGRKVLGRCVVKRVGARKSVTCKITLKKSYSLKKVRVTAKFTAVNGKTAVRRSFVIR